MKCKYCGYEWESRKENPISCPRCKRRFDYDKINKVDSDGDKN